MKRIGTHVKQKHLLSPKVSVSKRVLTTLFAFLLLLNFVSPIYAKDLNPLLTLAESYIVKTEHENEVTYSNLQGFYDAVRAEALEISDYELATFTLSYMRPDEEDFANEFSGNTITEVLSYYNYTIESSVMKVSSDGTTVLATEDEVQQLSLLSSMGAENNSRGISTTSDGYIQFTTTKAQNGMSGTDRRYVLTVTASWLIKPFWRYEDVIAITYGGSIDDTYAFYANHLHRGTCVTCGNTMRNSTSIAYGPSYVQTADNMYFDYSQSNAISAKVELGSLTCNVCEGGTQISDITETELSTYLRIGILVSGTSETRSAYTHTTGRINVTISGSVSPGASGGVSVMPSFDVSRENRATNYVAPPLTLTVY